ncbi:carbohydrate-binding protein [Chaetomium sp. MPI-CAGE-AT-0009]|nr:carbohydrate-binding protein [Chaetomium sp. MPI-CAGE-AT-0009]
MSASSPPCTFAHPRDAAKVPFSLAKIKKVDSFCAGDKLDVTEVHNYLKRFGFMPADASPPSADSAVGEETSTAIKAFQKFFALTVDGVFGPKTRAAMSEARCGFPDLLHAVDFSVSGPWPSRKLRYAFGKMTRQLPDENVAKAAVRRALNTWANAVPGMEFKLVDINASPKPDFIIEWRPAADPDHSMVGGVLAHADFPPGFSIVVTGPPLPCHYDDDEHTWVDGAVANGFDIETIGLHEIGHILGLYHSSVPGAVMFPTVSANLTKRTLTPDDQQGIRNLYPAWRHLGGRWSGVCSWADGRTDVFVRGINNAVFHKWQNGGGTAWGPAEAGFEDLGGIIYGNVTAVSWGANRIDLFALGTDNACWHKWWDGSRWGGWESLGGGVIGDVCAVSWGANRLDLFVRGMDNGVYHKAWNGSAWLPSKTGWVNLGGKILGAPKAVCWGPNRIDVLVRGTNNEVFQKTWNGSVWQPSVTGWKTLGGTIVDDVTPVSWGPNRLDLFVQGTNNAVFQKTWDGSAWLPSPTGWTSLGGVLVSKPSAVAWGGNKITIAGQGTDNACWIREWNGSAWSNWKSLGGVITDSPVLDPRGGDRIAVYVRGTDAGLYVYD